MTMQWGTRATLHKNAGLTLDATKVGAYGEIPEYWHDPTRSPRGAFNPTGAVAASIGGYYLRSKSDLWADNVSPGRLAADSPKTWNALCREPRARHGHPSQWRLDTSRALLGAR